MAISLRSIFGTLLLSLGLAGMVGCGDSSAPVSRDATAPGPPASRDSGARPSGATADSKPAGSVAGDQDPAGSSVTDAKWGNLRARFIYDGAAPDPAKLKIDKDVEVCGIHNHVDESLLAKSNGGVSNVLVWLYETPAEIHPSYDETDTATVELDNKNCRFEPRMCVVRTSQTLRVLNSDPVGHNTKADLMANSSFNPIIPANASLEFQLTAPERLPAPVSCNIHPWMNAWLFVQDHPYVAVSDADGNVELPNLPAGKWTFAAWHEKAGYVSKVTLGTKEVDWKRGRFEHTIQGGDNDLGQVKLKPALFEK